MAEAITGRIYRIISESHPECLPYYGSTIRSLKQRWNQHTSNAEGVASAQLMEFEDVRMELMEEFVCDSITTLHQREQWYIDNHPCCNKINAYGLDEKRAKEKEREYNKQYREANKEANKERRKGYEEANRDKIREQQKQRYAKKKALSLALVDSEEKEAGGPTP